MFAMLYVILLSATDSFWYFSYFFFNDTATTEIYTLSLHDALPILDDALAAKPNPACLWFYCKFPAISGPRAEFRSEEHTSELQSQSNLVCRLLLEKKNKKKKSTYSTTRASTQSTSSTRLITSYISP